MNLRAIARGLLLALAFGVVTAAHPCAALAPGLIPPAPGHSSCHSGMAHHHSAPIKQGGCCDPRQGDPTVCQKACQAIAVLGLPAALPGPMHSPHLASPSCERFLSQFVAAIDHIPLA